MERGKILNRFRRILKILLITLGILFSVQILLALTSAPFWIWYGMGTKHAGINRPPEYIVVLGGGGMPSESGLMRCWYAAKAANFFPQSKIIIALPGDTADSLSSVSGMKKELILRGIAPERITTEDSGTNTRAQAVNIYRMTSPPSPPLLEERGTGGEAALLLVTSPEHLARAVLVFKKAGFLKVDGLPAFEEAIEADITFQGKRLGGRRWVPDIGENITIRYQFWTQMHYEMLVIREWMATGYYWIKGWI
jgi:uncharacterized SAM-binding protein YcdF (DUF218 family)